MSMFVTACHYVGVYVFEPLAVECMSVVSVVVFVSTVRLGK